MRHGLYNALVNIESVLYQVFAVARDRAAADGYSVGTKFADILQLFKDYLNGIGFVRVLIGIKYLPVLADEHKFCGR